MERLRNYLGASLRIDLGVASERGKLEEFIGNNKPEYFEVVHEKRYVRAEMESYEG